jgi:hypothetical protein
MTKKYIHKALVGIGVLVAGLSTSAQNSNLLYYFENIPQSNYTNPAMMPRANGFLGLPGLSSFSFSTYRCGI